MRGKTDRVNFVFYTMLKELDNAMGVMAIKYQYPLLTSRPKSSVSIFKLDSNVSDRDVGPDTISDTFRARTFHHLRTSKME